MEWRIERRSEVGSTSDVVWKEASRGVPEGLVVVAERQSRGRGRHGRRWASCPGNLHASWLLRPPVPIGRCAVLSLVVGLAIRDGLLDLAPGLDVRLKWPNDVLVSGAKLGGVLLEGSEGTSGRALVVGVGVNLRCAPPVEDRPTICLAGLGVRDPDPFRVLERLLEAFSVRYGSWIDGGFAAMREEWMEAAFGLGEPTSVHLGGTGTSGRFVEVDAEGALILETADGRLRRFVAGELAFACGAF